MWGGRACKWAGMERPCRCLREATRYCGSAEVGGGWPPVFARQGNSAEAPGGRESGRRLPLRLGALCCAAWGSAQPLGGAVCRGHVEPRRSVDSLREPAQLSLVGLLADSLLPHG